MIEHDARIEAFREGDIVPKGSVFLTVEVVVTQTKTRERVPGTISEMAERLHEHKVRTFFWAVPIGVAAERSRMRADLGRRRGRG